MASWVSLAALAPRPSALLMRSVVAPRMQGYGQQGYGAPQGYGVQQGYGGPQGYDQQGGGAPTLWRVEGFSGVTGHAREAPEKYSALPYFVPGGDETVLSRWNMMMPRDTVSRVQALVRVGHDGTPLLVSCGRGATLWRRGGGPWNGLVNGQTHILANGDQVSLDWSNPEGAVFTCVQLQGGYQQQDSYPVPLEVPQLMGGYQQQQGGYPYGQGGFPQQGGGYPGAY